MVAVATQLDWELHQMDVKTAFLNGDLNEVIYTQQPEGFVDPESPNLVLKLNKSVYGLKQAGRSWYFKIDEVLRKFGFSHLHTDPCLYQLVGSGYTIWIALYVDDLLIASNNLEKLEEFKKRLSRTFKMVDKGEVEYILGIEVIRDRAKRSTLLSQRRYAGEVLTRFGMDSCSSAPTPMVVSLKTSPPAKNAANAKFPYLEAVGALQYLAQGTRPDIAYPVSKLAQRCHCYNVSDWEAVKRVFRYLSGTINLSLSYHGSADSDLMARFAGYCDSDWGSDAESRVSVTGYVFSLSGGAISW
jgi:hypothetical protein